MGKIIAIVGMAGAGKSVASQVFEEIGYPVVHFGDATQRYLKEKGLTVNEKNEKMAREQLRKENGMAAFAIVNKPLLDKALEKGNVVIDGLYSWEEYVYLKEHYDDSIVVLAIYVSPRTRTDRLKIREVRPLAPEERADRDKAEIENLNKAGPIAMADYTILNEGPISKFKAEVQAFARQYA
ncbi:MAG: dephospho-CoA kinase [Nanoarchaeota archaeon]|nr:MAG: dephospho-CoA kinase [Nanoarchaeota archaeon]